MSLKDVRGFMEVLSQDYTGISYNLITRNCNHFCNDACLRLTGNPIPNWIIRLVRICKASREEAETRMLHCSAIQASITSGRKSGLFNMTFPKLHSQNENCGGCLCREKRGWKTDEVETQSDGGRRSSRVVQYNWWLKIAVFTFFALSGQSVATMLGRLYFNNGGKSKWMITLVQTAGFPLMYPFIFFSPSKTQPENHHVAGKPSWTTLVIL
ncbi:hypothetical protein L2E82_40194 [Cichorium intybus]|uniref:Uncharacterized protein n=1 Tax=Cichorium intybus TaxID=13427 RepID=A0ACB9AJL7_CICIN|nr:hypothetical protein L2E82_40194 [Cichorium intybus]